MTQRRAFPGQRRPMPIKPMTLPGGRGVFTPQDKLVAVSNNFGLPGIQDQQGTTVIKYDSLPLDGSTTYRFF